MERTHSELRAGLTNGLGGNDAHRLAELDHATRCQRAAVTHGADSDFGIARQHGTNSDTSDTRVVTHQLHDGLVDLGVALVGGAVVQRDRLRQHTTEQVGLQIAAPAFGIGSHVLQPATAR